MSEDRLLTRAFVLIFVANFLQGLGFNLYLNLPGFLQKLGADEFQIGVIFSATAVSAILARPSIGRTMDLRGRRRVFLMGGAMNVVVCALYLTVHEIGPWIVFVRVLHGLSEAMLFSALFTYGADLVPASRRTEGIALFGISGLLPISVGGALGEVIEQGWGYPAVFVVAVGFAVASLLLCLPLRDQKVVADDDGEPARGFTAAFRQADLLPIWWVSTIFTTSLASVFTFMKTFVLEAGFGSMTGFFTAYSCAGVLLRLFFAHLPDRVGPKRMFFPAIGTLMSGFVLLAAANSSAAVIAAGVLCGLGHGFVFPILMGLVVSRARDAERGAAMAIFTAVFDAGMLIGGPSFGFVIGRVGYSSAFALAAGLLFTGAVVFAVWDRGRGN